MGIFIPAVRAGTFVQELPSKIAVLGAFRVEVEQIGQRVSPAGGPLQSGCLKYVTGSLCGRSLLVGTTGVGKVRSAAGTQAAIDRHEPGLILICGTAGALSKSLRVMDLVVAERTLQHDTGPDDPPWLSVETWLVERFLEASRKALAGTGNTALCGGLITGDRPVLDRRERKRLAGRFDALAVDMEAAAAAAVASAAGIPLAVVKAITDSADRKGIRDFKKHLQRCADLAQQAVACFLEE